MSTDLFKIVLVSVHEGDNSMLSLDLETYRQSKRNTLRFWWQFNNFGNCRRTFLMCMTILNILILQAFSLCRTMNLFSVYSQPWLHYFWCFINQSTCFRHSMFLCVPFSRSLHLNTIFFFVMHNIMALSLCTLLFKCCRCIVNEQICQQKYALLFLMNFNIIEKRRRILGACRHSSLLLLVHDCKYFSIHHSYKRKEKCPSLESKIKSISHHFLLFLSQNVSN